MALFFVVFAILIVLNALLLLFSSNRRLWAAKPSSLAGLKPDSRESLQLNSFDSDYQKAV